MPNPPRLVARRPHRSVGSHEGRVRKAVHGESDLVQLVPSHELRMVVSTTRPSSSQAPAPSRLHVLSAVRIRPPRRSQRTWRAAIRCAPPSELLPGQLDSSATSSPFRSRVARALSSRIVERGHARCWDASVATRSKAWRWSVSYVFMSPCVISEAEQRIVH